VGSIVLPTLFGVAKIPVRRFAVFSFISTLLWVIIIGNLGFFFSDTLLYGLSQLKTYWPALLTIAILAGFLTYYSQRQSPNS
jgi:membrane protein DedA with SNARE-associated domain